MVVSGRVLPQDVLQRRGQRARAVARRRARGPLLRRALRRRLAPLAHRQGARQRHRQGTPPHHLPLNTQIQSFISIRPLQALLNCL